MKKYIPVVLIAILTCTQIAANAHPAHDQAHAEQVAKASGYADAQSMRDDMHKKMSSAKTDAERQQLMQEHLGKQ